MIMNSSEPGAEGLLGYPRQFTLVRPLLQYHRAGFSSRLEMPLMLQGYFKMEAAVELNME